MGKAEQGRGREAKTSRERGMKTQSKTQEMNANREQREKG